MGNINIYEGPGVKGSGFGGLWAQGLGFKGIWVLGLG